MIESQFMICGDGAQVSSRPAGNVLGHSGAMAAHHSLVFYMKPRANRFTIIAAPWQLVAEPKEAGKSCCGNNGTKTTTG
jgi:hypothetical protein